MAKVLRGTQDVKQFAPVRNARDQRHIRCKKCGDSAVPAPDGKGGTVYQCNSCHARYTFKMI